MSHSNILIDQAVVKGPLVDPAVIIFIHWYNTFLCSVTGLTPSQGKLLKVYFSPLWLDEFLMCLKNPFFPMVENINHQNFLLKQTLCLQLECLNQSELASRLTLNCSSDYVQPQKVQVTLHLSSADKFVLVFCHVLSLKHYANLELPFRLILFTHSKMFCSEE